MAIILQFKDWYFLDPALMLAITLYILWGVGGRLKDILYLMLQGISECIDLQEVHKELQQVAHVNSLHHVHVWSLDGQHHILTAHLVLEGISRYGQVDEVRQQAIQSVEE